jgi:hypothetical protein
MPETLQGQEAKPMNWLNEQYAKERYEDNLREIQHEQEIELLRTQAEEKPESEPRRVRKAVGGKLIELGKRLQDAQTPAEPPTSSKRNSRLRGVTS